MNPALNKHMFFYVYILRSIKSSRLYIGFTDDLRERLEKHNNFKVKSTKAFAPYELIYFEGYRSIKLAAEREQKLKQFGQAYRRLKERLGLNLNAY